MPDNPLKPDPAAAPLSAALLAWYDHARRDLPWRTPPGEKPDPYRVWISEIMLQQTTVAAVRPFYRDFTQRWPDVQALAAAELDAVLHAWQGLGYYARARNLHACAVRVAGDLRGHFPATEAELRALPGIGAYTAAAIAAIAFDQPATPVDGNVLRVASRLFTVEAPLPCGRSAIERLARTLTPRQRPGDFAQAMMDLGATICTPRAPCCTVCPVRSGCAAFAAGTAEAYPRRVLRRQPETRSGIVFWAEREGRVLLRRRPLKGLLGGLMEFPSTPWDTGAPCAEAAALAAAPVAARWTPLEGEVRHTFTHFRLVLRVLFGRCDLASAADGGCVWWPQAELGRVALPTLMKKVARHVAHARDRQRLPLEGGTAAGYAS